jgi:ribonuclease T2
MGKRGNANGMTIGAYRAAALIAAAAAATAAFAQVAGPVPPQPQWQAAQFDAPQRKNVPGDFDYYTLVMSWSPTHCASADIDPDDAQCSPGFGVRYGFILHGLWPQYEKGYPERCYTRWKPFVPDAVIEDVFDVMPSRGLVIHQYREHGTCSGLRPAPYFALAEGMFNSITVPERYRNPLDAQFVAPGEVVSDFLRANPKLKPDMIAIVCGGAGNRLREVRICMTKAGAPRSCGMNERRGTTCRASRMFVPPVKSKQWDYEKNELPDRFRPRYVPKRGH